MIVIKKYLFTGLHNWWSTYVGIAYPNLACPLHSIDQGGDSIITIKLYNPDAKGEWKYDGSDFWSQTLCMVVCTQYGVLGLDIDRITYNQKIREYNVAYELAIGPIRINWT